MSDLRDQINRYFAGELEDAAARRMFEALAEAPEAARYFAARQAFAELDPRAVKTSERIGRSLGLGAAQPRRSPGWLLLPALAAAAGALLLFVVPTDDGFAPRGPASRPSVSVYVAGPSPARLGDSLAASDELMFSYQVSEAGYLAIFAVDGRGEVFWYEPAWTDPAQEPKSRRVEPSDRPQELPEAVRHALAPGPLRLFAVVMDAPLSVRDIEARLPPSAVDAEELPFARDLWTTKVSVR